MLNFETLRKTTKPNRWLAASAQLLQQSEADAPAPLINSKPEAVLAAVQKLLESDPSASEVKFDENTHQLSYVAKIFVFKDDVDLKLIPLGDDSTELAIYSRSRVGYSDFGVNQKRVEKLVADLKAAL